MNIDLFTPCFKDRFYPKAAVATFILLQRLVCLATYLIGRTWRVQPMANSAFASSAKALRNSRVYKLIGHLFYQISSCVPLLKQNRKIQSMVQAAYKGRFKV